MSRLQELKSSLENERTLLVEEIQLLSSFYKKVTGKDVDSILEQSISVVLGTTTDEVLQELERLNSG